MMFQRFFPKRPAVEAGKALYAPLIAQARLASFYIDGQAPDTLDGRFELYALHLALVTRRLKGEGRFEQEASQALFDAFIDGLDYGLREMGVGDLSVPKKMRKMGAAIYGRFKSYDAALVEGSPPKALEDVLARTVYSGVKAPPTGAMAIYVRRAADALAALPSKTLFSAPLPWPRPEFLGAS